MRQMLDASLEGTLQHKWSKEHNNIKPEITWSQFRRRCAPGFEDAMQRGVDANWYNPNDDFHKYVSVQRIYSDFISCLLPFTGWCSNG